MKVLWKTIREFTFRLLELGEKLTKDIAAEVAFLAFDLDKLGAPEEV